MWMPLTMSSQRNLQSCESGFQCGASAVKGGYHANREHVHADHDRGVNMVLIQLHRHRLWTHLDHCTSWSLRSGTVYMSSMKVDGKPVTLATSLSRFLAKVVSNHMVTMHAAYAIFFRLSVKTCWCTSAHTLHVTEKPSKLHHLSGHYFESTREHSSLELAATSAHYSMLCINHWWVQGLSWDIAAWNVGATLGRHKLWLHNDFVEACQLMERAPQTFLR